MKTYRSTEKEAQNEIVIKKSRFIGYAVPVSDEKEAEKKLEQLKEKHKDAAHNVFAWQIGIDKISQKCSDDGEPSGTAGKPLLEVIKQNELTNILIVVTRYFGGIKLGAGGLIRAYSEAARKVIDKAGIVENAQHMVYEVIADYSFQGQLQYELKKWSERPQIDYEERVKFFVPVILEKAESFCEYLKNVTGNQVEIKEIGRKYCSIK